ncbi:MAG: TRAP transporter small permease subunit [Rhodobacteraceae bacterium]|nr:TRAP transporter small permease subunit [Paracoccaceae bacterium]
MLAYVRWVDRMNRAIGRVVMYGIFVMMGILLWSTFTKVGSDMGFGINPSLWTLEMAQFAMVAYYILGGPYAIQMGSNVRMDLLYSGQSERRKAWMDAFTVLFLIFYLVVLLWGGLSSTSYSLGDFRGEPFTFFWNIIKGFFTGGFEGAGEVIGHLERSNSVWRAYLWPIKLLMVIGIFLMLLQAMSELCKDILRIKGHDMGEKV